MYIITQMSDLTKARNKKKFPDWLLDILAREFMALCEQLGDGIEPAEFSLETHGPMAVWEDGDHDLTPLLAGRLEDSWYEFVEDVRLEDGCSYWRVGLLLDNDFMILIFLLPEAVDFGIRAWLDEHADVVEGGMSYDSCQPSPF